MESRKCKKCNIEKGILQFRKSRKLWRYHECNECRNKRRRTGKSPHRFPKGVLSSKTPFKKGHKPWNFGKLTSPETKKKMRLAKLGKKQSSEHIEKCRISRRTGANRKSHKYNEWARQVKERDDYKCQHCGLLEVEKLQAHHVIPWEDSIELRFDTNNGLTLCRVCHTKEDRRIKPLIAWNKGKKLCEEHRAKLSLAKKGKAPWNKGKKSI